MTFDLLQEEILLWIEFREFCVTHAPRWETDCLCISLHFPVETSRRFFTWVFQASQQLLSFFADPTPIFKAQQPFRHFQENKMEKKFNTKQTEATSGKMKETETKIGMQWLVQVNEQAHTQNN